LISERRYKVVDQFENLFSPISIGDVIVPNRIMFSAHAARYHPFIEAPNERTADYYSARAKGGTGLIVTSPNFPCWPSTMPFHTALESDDSIPAYSRLADAIHEHGSIVFGQLSHFGSYAHSRTFGGGSTYAPSAISRISPFYPMPRDVPYEMTLDDIKRFIEAYVQATRRLEKAGYDGAEIGAMWGMLHNSFLSPVMNHRSDQYGGSLENRMRFLLETLSALRESLGSRFVLGVRFTGDEFADGGLTIEDAREIAQKLEASGLVDYLFSCAGLQGTQHVPSMYYPLAPFAYISAGVKQVTKLPVVAVGRINDPVLAEGIIANHQADMIAMVRALIADPDMPRKAREGRLDDIRKCIGCNEGCFFPPWRHLPLTCAVNPEAGREKEFAITPAPKKKTVMIIGGGAAGLETARVAALRGHKVSLYEKEDILAKDLVIASKSPGRAGWDDARRYLVHQVNHVGVDVHLGVEVDAQMVLEQDADAVVVATGALPFVPEFPGSDSDNVVEMMQVLQGKAPVGDNVVVVAIQHHMHGLQMADFLTEDNKKVQILTTSAYAGDRLDYFTVEDVYTRLLAKGVIFTPLTGVKEVRGSVVTTYNVLTGDEKQIEGVDTIVFCTPGRANNGLYKSLYGKVKGELHQVGQCVTPREFLDSVHDAAFVARML
jgi:2,4-dienoyl-CoA reductase-like NADH-dependent reductase (Old Yellow Enzyme family)/thioredoxin reductase